MTIQIIYYTQLDFEEKQALTGNGHFISSLSYCPGQFYIVSHLEDQGGVGPPLGVGRYTYVHWSHSNTTKGAPK